MADRERLVIRRKIGSSASRPRAARLEYHSTKFQSVACEEQFQLDMLHRSVTISKYVDFTGWESMQIQEMFDNIGLQGVYSVRGDSIDRIVRLFYANMSFSGRAETIKTYILGTKIVITREMVNQIIGFVGEEAERYYQAVQNCPFTGTAEGAAFFRQIIRSVDVGSSKPRARDLTVKARVLHNMVSHTLLPQHRHRDLVNFMDLYVMEKLYSGRMFDPGFLILCHMCEIGRTRNKNLPYGVLIVKIIEHLQIEVPQGEPRRSQRSSEVFGQIHLVRIGLVETDGMWTSKDEEAPQDDVHVEPSTGTSHPGTSGADVDSLTDRVGRMKERMTEMMDTLKQMMNYQRDMFDYQRGTRQIILDWMGANDEDDRPMGSNEGDVDDEADAQPMESDDDAYNR